jgi:hypothetical protein
VYRSGGILGSVGHRVKIHTITPATGKERGDLEIKDYVVLQKPQEQDDRLPPRTRILDFTLTHTLYGRKPMAFLPVAVDTSGHVYDDFSRLLFLHANSEASALANEILEESDQFRFLRAACYANIKGSVGLILAKDSTMRISIPLDLSSRSFMPLLCFMRSRRPLPLLAPSLVFTPRCST